MDINSFRGYQKYECYNCKEIKDGYCERYECNCCGTCEGDLYFFGDELDFSLCSKCLILIQAQIQKGLIKSKQSLNITTISEKLIVLRKTMTEDERQKVFDRDNWQCVLCGSIEHLQVDHKFPFSKGGTTEMSNLQTLCKKCNTKKSNRCVDS